MKAPTSYDELCASAIRHELDGRSIEVFPMVGVLKRFVVASAVVDVDVLVIDGSDYEKWDVNVQGYIKSNEEPTTSLSIDPLRGRVTFPQTNDFNAFEVRQGGLRIRFT